MNECPLLSRCPFVKYCEDNDAVMSVKGFTSLYCKSEKQDECIRKRLSDTFNITVVPMTMMPNGLPLPGSIKENWSDEALNYRSLLNAK